MNNEIHVWDVLVRTLHWTLVVTFSIAYLTEDNLMTLHVYSGYAVLIIVLIRTAWGLIGTRYARFSDFLYSPKAIISYLKDLASLHAKRYIGHNPAGGAMIILLLLFLILTGISGVAVYATEENTGPLADSLYGISHFWEEVIEKLHELLANFTLLLILIHIAGVLYGSLLHKENLIRSMFTGRKRP